MTLSNWQLLKPIQAIAFDCDGTLTTLEGINELARNRGLHDKVEHLTSKAMGHTGLTSTIYKKRLELIRPSKEEINHLGYSYYQNKVDGICKILKIYKRFNKEIFLISAGLFPAIKIFGKLLNLKSQNIYAVDIFFDKNNNYIGFDETSPLVTNDGKKKILNAIKNSYPNIAMIGDGLNDYIANDIVTRFIGFGGVFYRDNLAQFCDFYITEQSLLPILPLTFTADEINHFSPEEVHFYQQGLAALNI